MLFDFSRGYILENNTVRLEPLIKEHIKELRILAAEEDLWTYFIGKSNGAGRFNEYIHDALKQREHKKEYPFAIFDKAKNKYAGSTRFFDLSEQQDVIRLGYTWYGKEFRGTTINKNCKYLLLEFAFEHLKVARVGLGAHAENKVSIAAMKSIGCREEGVIRNLFPSIHDLGRSNAVLLGILHEEWINTVKNNLKNRL